MGEADTISGRVSVAIADGVAEVRLDRPDKLNALDPAMFEALIEAGERLRRTRGLARRRSARRRARLLRRARHGELRRDGVGAARGRAVQS